VNKTESVNNKKGEKKKRRLN